MPDFRSSTGVVVSQFRTIPYYLDGWYFTAYRGDDPGAWREKHDEEIGDHRGRFLAVSSGGGRARGR